MHYLQDVRYHGNPEFYTCVVKDSLLGNINIPHITSHLELKKGRTQYKMSDLICSNKSGHHFRIEGDDHIIFRIL